MTWQARERPRHVPCLLRRLFSVFFVCIVAIALCAQANDRHTYDHAPNLLDTACGPHSSANSTSSPNAPSLVPNSPLLVNAPRRLEKQEEDAVVNFTVEENCINIHSSATGDHNNFSSSVSSSSPPSASSDASGGTSSSSSSAASAAKSMASGDHNAVLLLPGFASSQLYNWRFKDCFPFSYNLADRVWIDVAKILGAPTCWVECMKLVPEDLSDPPNGCKLRPGEGMTAIGELDPGILTGPLSTVWQEFVRAMVEIFDYEPGTTIVAAPYDFRLAPSKLQERDYFFRSLMVKIELTVETQRRTKKLAHPGLIVMAHSMGNNVFRYFLEWLEDYQKDKYQAWLDDNIAAYVAVGAPLLGAPQAFEGIMSGVTFGLPRISPELAREMASTFGTPSWNIPFNPRGEHSNIWPIDNLITITANADWAKTQQQRDTEAIRQQEEALLAAANAEYERSNETNDQQKAEALQKRQEQLKKRARKNDKVKPFPWTQVYNSSQILDALNDIAPVDSKVNNTVNIINKYYLSDPVMEHYTTWSRPPIKKVICAYGINMRTELGYHYTTDLLREQWRIEDITYEDKGRIYSELTGATYPSGANTKSGDGTVPYVSLSWCHRWLGDDVTVTKIPQRFYNKDDPNKDIIIQGEPLITFYESVNKTGRGSATAVWEIDAVDHRDVIKNRVFLREFAEEILHEHSILQQMAGEYGEGSPSIPSFGSFAHKHARVPRGDYDCAWDYLAAKCKYPEFCEYRYVFGDLTLDQSCRLKPSVKQQIIPPSVAHAVSAPHTEVVVETDEMVAVVDQQRVVEVERTAHEGTVRDGGKVLHM